MSETIYWHFYRIKECDTEEQAKKDCELQEEILKTLAERFFIGMRIFPEYRQDRLFEDNRIRYYSIARYSVTQSSVDHPVGILNPKATDEELTRFGEC